MGNTTDPANTAQANKLTPTMMEHFRCLGVKNPDPNGDYDFNQLAADKLQEVRGLYNTPTQKAELENHENEIRRAQSYLGQHWENKRQKKAHAESGADGLPKYTQAFQAWKVGTYDQYYGRGGKGEFIGVARQAHDLIQLLISLLINGVALCEDFPGAEPYLDNIVEELIAAAAERGQELTDAQQKEFKQIWKDGFEDYVDVIRDNNGKAQDVTLKPVPADLTPADQKKMNDAREAFHARLDKLGFKLPTPVAPAAPVPA